MKNITTNIQTNSRHPTEDSRQVPSGYKAEYCAVL